MIIEHILKKYIGLTEKAGLISSPTIIGWIRKYLPNTKDDGDVAYCSIALIEVFKELGLKLPQGVNATARSWLPLVTPSRPLEYGDAVVFKRGKSWQGHIAIFIREDAFGYIYHLGFNQANSCSIDKTHKSNLLGYYNLHNIK